MAFNVPNYDVDNLTFGPGILYLCAITVDVGTVTEANDLQDVGAVSSGATFAVTRTRLDVVQGNPATKIATFVTAESAVLTVTGLEWDMDNLALAIGAGAVSTAGDEVTFGFGGDLNVSDVAVKYIHSMPSGATLTLRLWHAEGQGDLSVTFGDALHEIPYSYAALETSTKWGGSTLGATQRLFQLVKANPPA